MEQSIIEENYVDTEKQFHAHSNTEISKMSIMEASVLTHIRADAAIHSCDLGRVHAPEDVDKLSDEQQQNRPR